MLENKKAELQGDHETYKAYVSLMEGCVAAWNRSDAEATAAFYAEDLDYRDPNLPNGIHSREKFTKYLRILFRLWPEQQWTGKIILPHAKPGAFSISYNFRFANGRKSIQGFGIDRLEFEGDKIKLNHVYLNADQWPHWIKQ